MKRPQIQILLPVYNESKSLPLLFERLSELESAFDLTYIFIDDGSSDDGDQQILAFISNRPGSKLIQLARNGGHVAALWAGLEHLDDRPTMILDADLQDPPEALPALWERSRKGSQPVVVKRQASWSLDYILATPFYLALWLLRPRHPKLRFGTHCLLDATTLRVMRVRFRGQPYFPRVLAESAKSLADVEYQRGKRQFDRSRVGLTGKIMLAWRALRVNRRQPLPHSVNK